VTQTAPNGSCRGAVFVCTWLQCSTASIDFGPDGFGCICEPFISPL